MTEPSPTLRPQLDELCFVVRVRNEQEGAMVHCRLDAAGIESFTHGEFLAGFRAGAPAVVRQRDRVAAHEALASTPAARTAS